MNIKLILIIFLGSAGAWASSFGGASSRSSSDLQVSSYRELAKTWGSFEGRKISQIVFSGNTRSRELAMTWIMDSKIGQTFNGQRLARDLQVLSNTGVLYDISADVKTSQKEPETVVIQINVKDKWTIIPIFGAEGGGGSVVYGGGIYDTNIAGFFINGLFLGYNYNGIFSYRFNLSQDYIAGSDFIGAIDWSNNVNPTIIHNIDNSSAGQYTWQRQQEEILVGYHVSDSVRFALIADAFKDSIVDAKGLNVAVYSGDQYKLRPSFILGRTNIKNYLEESSELRFSYASSNFFGPAPSYQEYRLEYKFVGIRERDNYGFFIGGGAMTSAPPPYEFMVGGYGNLRGFIDSRQIGPYLLRGNVEYRPYLCENHAEGVTKFVLQGNIFTDFGSAWGDSLLVGDSGARQINMLWSVGAGVRVNLIKFAGAILRLDVARTIRADEGWGFTFGVGQFF